MLYYLNNSCSALHNRGSSERLSLARPESNEQRGVSVSLSVTFAAISRDFRRVKSSVPCTREERKKRERERMRRGMRERRHSSPTTFRTLRDSTIMRRAAFHTDIEARRTCVVLIRMEKPLASQRASIASD